MLLLGVPKSPRWLFSVGRIEESMQVLALSTGVAVDDPTVQAQKEEIVEAMQLEERSGRVRWTSLFKQDEVLCHTIEPDV